MQQLFMSVVYMWSGDLCYGVFPLPNSYSDTDSNSYENGYNSNVQNCFHWTYSETYACSDSNSNGYCTHFGTDIGNDKGDLN